MDDVFSNIFVKLTSCSCMDIYMYRRICYLIVELCVYIVHTRLSLIIEIVMDAQHRIGCKLAHYSVPLIMGIMILINLH
jgi:hypothetical protein